MQEKDIGFSVVAAPPFAPELFEMLAHGCFQAAAKIAYYAASDITRSGRLTKKFLMSAPAGCFLTSNCYFTTLTGSKPIFAETLAESEEDRLQQWERIKSVAANDRLCYLHKSRSAYEQLKKLAEFGGVFQN